MQVIVLKRIEWDKQYEIEAFEIVAGYVTTGSLEYLHAPMHGYYVPLDCSSQPFLLSAA